MRARDVRMTRALLLTLCVLVKISSSKKGKIINAFYLAAIATASALVGYVSGWLWPNLRKRR